VGEGMGEDDDEFPLPVPGSLFAGVVGVWEGNEDVVDVAGSIGRTLADGLAVGAWEPEDEGMLVDGLAVEAWEPEDEGMLVDGLAVEAWEPEDEGMLVDRLAVGAWEPEDEGVLGVAVAVAHVAGGTVPVYSQTGEMKPGTELSGRLVAAAGPGLTGLLPGSLASVPKTTSSTSFVMWHSELESRVKRPASAQQVGSPYSLQLHLSTTP